MWHCIATIAVIMLHSVLLLHSKTSGTHLNPQFHINPILSLTHCSCHYVICISTAHVRCEQTAITLLAASVAPKLLMFK